MTVMCDGRQAPATLMAEEGPIAGELLTPGRAARELGLRGGEFELAAQLGEILTLPPDPEARPGPAGPWRRRRVPAEEVRRLRAEEGFPGTLRERLRTVGAAEAAELLGIGAGRFLRLARAGCFVPVRFYVNRYGAVVWLYLATELTECAARQPELLRGDLPLVIRVMLDGGQDWRGRKWRSRRVARLMGQAVDDWESAAVIAAVLPPEELASVVEDPLERSVLRRLRPVLALPGASPAAREAVERATTAEEFDEVLWYRVNLSRSLDRARHRQPAAGRLRHPTRPGGTAPTGPEGAPFRIAAAPTAPTAPASPATATVPAKSLPPLRSPVLAAPAPRPTPRET
ncbi:DUF6397 family protein [Streptomyces monomycini]|uniref:DUF6397 family protein n=1 Tax=Streptomyces monomycini TaxID=371720 RepID=UPI001EEAE827|nr:DUF6397 family protein [Streptomyces monomycini]